eukprot:gene6626-6855_t
MSTEWRPARVCLCSALPDPLIALHGQVVILMHPHETKRALATVPLLSKVLGPSSLMLLVGRKLLPEKFPEFWQLLKLYVLLVLDGTWRHAKEMFDALPPELIGPQGAALQDSHQDHALKVLQASLMAPLQLLTQQQSVWDPAVRARSAGSSCVVASKSKLGMGRRLQQTSS